MLPHDARLAGDNALKALSADTSKGATADLLKGANDAHAAGRLPLALAFARKAAEKLGSAEAKSTYGELLLEAGCVEPARAAFAEAHQLAELTLTLARTLTLTLPSARSPRAAASSRGCPSRCGGPRGLRSPTARST